MENQVLAIIARIAGKEPSELKPETNLVADLEIDSPKALELICDLEDELKIELPDEAFDNLETVGDVLKTVCGSQAEAQA